MLCACEDGVFSNGALHDLLKIGKDCVPLPIAVRRPPENRILCQCHRTLGQNPVEHFRGVQFVRLLIKLPVSSAGPREAVLPWLTFHPATTQEQPTHRTCESRIDSEGAKEERMI